MLECVLECLNYSEIVQNLLGCGVFDTIFNIIANQSTTRTHRSTCHNMIERMLSGDVNGAYVVENKLVSRLAHIMMCDGERGFQFGFEMICLLYSNAKHKQAHDLDWTTFSDAGGPALLGVHQLQQGELHVSCVLCVEPFQEAYCWLSLYA